MLHSPGAMEVFVLDLDLFTTPSFSQAPIPAIQLDELSTLNQRPD